MTRKKRIMECTTTETRHQSNSNFRRRYRPCRSLERLRNLQTEIPKPPTLRVTPTVSATKRHETTVTGGLS